MPEPRHVVQARAREKVGRRCYWQSEQRYRGTIAGIVIGRGGYPSYMIAWDDGAPKWWGNVISAATKALIIEESKHA